jgi:hypothetical protein
MDRPMTLYSLASTFTRASARTDHLVGARLRWKRYRRWTSAALAGKCELCPATFTEGGEPGLTSGYSIVNGGPAGQDDYHWICAICYESWRDQFDWVVLDTLGRQLEPPGLLASLADLHSDYEPADVEDSDVYDLPPTEYVELAPYQWR